MAAVVSSPRGMTFPTREECVVADLLDARARSLPDKVFAVFADREWSYRETAEHAWRFGNGLAAPGSGSATTCRVDADGPGRGPAMLGINAAPRKALQPRPEVASSSTR